ncbi:MAG TPA: magnesium transporter [Candidatus Fimadaptatus faecigallinarum]|uniref:Magnesium transporter MgtE n=1 Tax=Candidatus Fimadaptatus faecigallinarum TaxID=2840814 RepID=A0A9D1LSE4_9FIRM|nr:magnesium transporter [Candidatus Fimadaptatus faecigallinarum]
MNTEVNFEELRELVESRNLKALRARLIDMNEVDVAQFLGELEPEDARLMFRALPKQMAADVFSNLDSDLQQVILESATDGELKQIMDELYVDDAVDMLEELPANVVKRVLKNSTREMRDVINQYLQYPENSAGSIMTAEFTDLRASMTVGEAIAHIRRTGEDRETIYTCYVIDGSRVLEGVITVKDLLLADDARRVDELMERDVISVNTLEDQEEVARVMSKYDLLSLPVVDNENRLVGVITIDDAVDVMEQEATEDFEVMGGIHPSEKTYLKTSVLEMSRNRIVWLLVLMVSGMITGGILGKFEAAISAMPLLVTFIPMLTDTGGNAGSQSSTMIIRGLATGDLTIRDLPRVLWKELRVALTVGVVLSAVNLVCVGVQYGDWTVGIVVAITMLFTVIMAKVVGGVLPLLANAVHIDPAIMAAPLITTVVDACSLIIFFAVCTAMLPV